MTLPDPPVPAECVMAGNDWFPLHFKRLRKSRWWRRASDLARARNVMLWGEAFEATPAGSLPDDDDELADAAGFGMDGIEAFIAAKAEIMAPWTLCSDGRWYHPTLVEVVLDAWERTSEKRKMAAEKKRAQREKARGVATKPADVPRDTRDVPQDTPAFYEDIEPLTRAPVTGQDTTGQDISDADASSVVSASPKPTPVRPDEIKTAFEEWNLLAERLSLPKARQLDDARRKAIRCRLANGGPEAWRMALAAIEASPHCRGENGRGWRADLDFVCQAKSWRRLLEGSYGAPTQDGATVVHLRATGPPSITDRIAEENAEVRRRTIALLEAHNG